MNPQFKDVVIGLCSRWHGPYTIAIKIMALVLLVVHIVKNVEVASKTRNVHQLPISGVKVIVVLLAREHLAEERN